MTLRYPDFASTCAGAKDTWGENYVQIEGEQGYLYIKGGSNGLASIRVVTGDADETFDEQLHPSRWYYEVQRLTELLRAENRAAFEERRRITTETVHVIEALAPGRRISVPDGPGVKAVAKIYEHPLGSQEDVSSSFAARTNEQANRNLLQTV